MTINYEEDKKKLFSFNTWLCEQDDTLRGVICANF